MTSSASLSSELANRAITGSGIATGALGTLANAYITLNGNTITVQRDTTIQLGTTKQTSIVEEAAATTTELSSAKTTNKATTQTSDATEIPTTGATTVATHPTVLAAAGTGSTDAESPSTQRDISDQQSTGSLSSILQQQKTAYLTISIQTPNNSITSKAIGQETSQSA